MKPVISIITPSYNQAQFLEQTIDSVLSQAYDNLQFIIIDGGSKDGSKEIIKKHEKYLSYWVSEPDRGQSHAINKGIQRATGEIFNWLNSDDYLEPGSLRIIAKNFEDPLIQVVCGKSNIVQSGKVIKTTQGTDVYLNNLPKTLGWARIDQPETYFRKNVFDKLGLLNEQLHFVMDKEFWMRFLINFGLSNIVKVPDLLVNFRIHDKSKTQLEQQAFTMETTTLFYQLAKQNGQTNEASFIEGLGGVQPIELEGLTASNSEVIKSSLHYFLLYKADEFYANNNSKRMRQLIDFIDTSFLVKEDASIVNKLKFRGHIPRDIISFIRKWR